VVRHRHDHDHEGTDMTDPILRDHDERIAALEARLAAMVENINLLRGDEQRVAALLRKPTTLAGLRLRPPPEPVQLPPEPTTDELPPPPKRARRTKKE
jgi:hypothetical protein